MVPPLSARRSCLDPRPGVYGSARMSPFRDFDLDAHAAGVFSPPAHGEDTDLSALQHQDLVALR